MAFNLFLAHCCGSAAGCAAGLAQSYSWPTAAAPPPDVRQDSLRVIPGPLLRLRRRMCGRALTSYSWPTAAAPPPDVRQGFALPLSPTIQLGYALGSGLRPREAVATTLNGYLRGAVRHTK